MSKLKFLMGYLTHYNAQKISIQYILTGNQPHDPNGVQPIHRIHQSHATGFLGGFFCFVFFCMHIFWEVIIWEKTVQAMFTAFKVCL